jgi:hypothetical protein
MEEEIEVEEKDEKEEEENTVMCLFLKTSIHRLRLQDQWYLFL